MNKEITTTTIHYQGMELSQALDTLTSMAPNGFCISFQHKAENLTGKAEIEYDLSPQEQEQAEKIRQINPICHYHPKLRTIRGLYKELYGKEAPEAVILFIFNGHYLNK